ncbi:unnamed protein product, partial [Ectocarpus sp. 12 AP-2014]
MGLLTSTDLVADPLAAPPLACSFSLPGLHGVFQRPLRQRLRQRRLLGRTRGLVDEGGGQVIHHSLSSSPWPSTAVAAVVAVGIHTAAAKAADSCYFFLCFWHHRRHPRTSCARARCLLYFSLHVWPWA